MGQSASDFCSYWDNVRKRTMRVAALVPPDKIEWSPGAGAMTFGDLLRHLAVTERRMFVENALGRPSQYTTHGPALADGHDAVLAYMQQMHDESMLELGTLRDADMELTSVTPGGAPLARWKWLRAMVEHESHHRGQIYLMLRLLGVKTPPLYGLTSEAVRARGQVGADPPERGAGE